MCIYVRVCVHACVYLVCVDSCMNTRALSRARARARVNVDGHCSVASSYVTLHIQLTYKYNDVTFRTTLLPKVSIQRDTTRRSKGVFSLELFRDLNISDSGMLTGEKNRLPITRQSLEFLLDLPAFILSIKKVVVVAAAAAAGGQWDWSMMTMYRY